MMQLSVEINRNNHISKDGIRHEFVQNQFT